MTKPQDKYRISTSKLLNQFDTDNYNIQQLVLAVGNLQMSVKDMLRLQTNSL